MKHYLLILIICFSATIYAQDLAHKVPENAPFAMFFNGKNLIEKVALKTIQEYPWMQNLLEKELKFLPKDLSQTGIDFNIKQYQYFVNKDSVMSYVMLIPLNNAVLFEKMIQGKYGDTIKVKKQTNYSAITTSKSHHLAWNDKFAVVINGSYTKPYTYKDDYSDHYGNAVIDTASINFDTPIYTEEIPSTDEVTLPPPPAPPKNKKSYKKGKKKSKKTATRVVEVVEPTEEELYAREEKAYAELEETNRKLEEIEQKKTDSIEAIKINASVALLFQETFNSGNEIALLKPTLFKESDPKADFYVFADLDALTTQLYSSFAGTNATLMGIYKNGILDSNIYMNGYFEKDKIRLSQITKPKNEETKKSYQAMFDSKMDKNLMNYLGSNVLAYYSISMDTEAIMHYEYKVLKNTLNTVYQAYDKDAKAGEADVLIDAIAIFLDEKAISDLAPGNAVFVLHDLKKVQRDFVNIDYDENYEQIETKGTKEEIQPDFTFVLGTKNETFLNKLLQLPLNKSKFTATDYQMTNGYYTLHFEKDNLLENLYIGVKNGVVMFTTVKENVENLIQQRIMILNADFKKSISKNNSSAWLDLQKIITASKTQNKLESNSNYYDIALKNAGEFIMDSKFKNGAIATESVYTIKGEHTNSLQYFFDVINECYVESKKEIIVTE